MYRIYLANDGEIAVFLGDGTPLSSSLSESNLREGQRFKHCFFASTISEAVDRIPMLYHSDEYPVNEWVKKILEFAKKLRDKEPKRRVYKSLGGCL